jgi:hypothetical protein
MHYKKIDIGFDAREVCAGSIDKDRIAVALSTKLDFDSVCQMFEADKNAISDH